MSRTNQWNEGREEVMGNDPGNDRCMAGGCEIRGAVRCNYVDRRSRLCSTTWCAEHQVMVGGRPYCRRHASLLEVLAGSPTVGGLPEVENRAASLAGFIGRWLDPLVGPIFARVAADTGAKMVNDPLRLVVGTGAGRSRSWRRSWKLVDHTGVLNKVSIEVEEANDSDVIARVDTELIGHGVPPWIEERSLGMVGAEGEDSRRAYVDAIARAIEFVVTREEMAPAY